MAVFILISLAAVAALQLWRLADDRNAARVWRELANTVPTDLRLFDPSLVRDLPEPAQRYFLYSIKLGARLTYVTEIKMAGDLSLGTKDQPNYAPMLAHQILAPPHGLVWKLSSGRGAMRITGSDGLSGNKSWTRFWLLYTIPVVRAGGNSDHARSAFGRTIAEGVFWTPAALLPQNGVNWEEVNENAARATFTFGGMTQIVDVTVASNGQPIQVVIPRWSNANPQKEYQYQPFGGYLKDFREFERYMLPTRVEGGNFIGTDAYFPFYKASIEDIRMMKESLSQ